VKDPQKEQHALGKTMLFASWIVLLALLTLLFNNILDEQRNPNQALEGRVVGDNREVTLERNRAGHYVANGSINGMEVVFLLDTGATDVALSSQLARRLGLRRGLPVTIQTANGTVTGYATRLRSVRLANIERHNVSATINPAMQDEDEVLLGMSFLKHLELTQRGNTLTLRQ
jgi:aspartyl protease family protein